MRSPTSQAEKAKIKERKIRESRLDLALIRTKRPKATERTTGMTWE
jgi:hypothetical protein